MAEDTKFNRDKIFKTIISTILKNSGEGGDATQGLDFRTARDLINAIAGWAGKGKDEIIQVLCREIGVATAAVLKEPLTQVVENQKLVITIEFSPKAEVKKATTDRATQKKAGR